MALAEIANLFHQSGRLLTDVGNNFGPVTISSFDISSSVAIVPLFLLCPPYLWTHNSSLPTFPLCLLVLYAYCSSVATVPQLCAHYPPVPTVPQFLLFLRGYCSSVPTIPLCLLFFFAHCSSVPTVLLCPLFLCAYCSSVPTVPLCLLSVPTVPLCLLFFCAYCSSVATVTCDQASLVFFAAGRNAWYNYLRCHLRIRMNLAQLPEVDSWAGITQGMQCCTVRPTKICLYFVKHVLLFRS